MDLLDGARSSTAAKHKGPCNPTFDSPDADILLLSTEGTIFRVHSFVLKMTSGLFQRILPSATPRAHLRAETPSSPSRPSSPSPPTPHSDSARGDLYADKNQRHPHPGDYAASLDVDFISIGDNDDNDDDDDDDFGMGFRLPAISLAGGDKGALGSGLWSHDVIAHDRTMERVLRMMYGLEMPRWSSFDELEEAVCLSEEWDARGPLSIMRSGCMAPIFMKHPIKLYGLAMKMGWEEEARVASKQTLKLHLYDEENQKDLVRISSKAVLKLLALHRTRRDRFKEMVDTKECFRGGNSVTISDEKEGRVRCNFCGIGQVGHHPWRELKARMFVEMDERPLGDTLTGLEMEDWPEAVDCWGATCSNELCHEPLYDKLTTLRCIKECVDSLLDTI